MPRLTSDPKELFRKMTQIRRAESNGSLAVRWLRKQFPCVNHKRRLRNRPHRPPRCSLQRRTLGRHPGALPSWDNPTRSKRALMALRRRRPPCVEMSARNAFASPGQTRGSLGSIFFNISDNTLDAQQDRPLSIRSGRKSWGSADLPVQQPVSPARNSFFLLLRSRQARR